MALDHNIEDKDREVPVDTSVDSRSGKLDFSTLKTGGIIKQRQKDKFTVRLKCPGGRVPLDKLARIVEVARKYAGDYVHISVRQSIELPYVDFRNVGKIQADLAEVGQEIASCGARVRVPSACSGCEYNPNGIANTQEMTARVTEQFFGKNRPLPHKFKISFSGCPIDCARTNEMDLGFQGAVRPGWDESACVGCRVCSHSCTEGAITCDADTGKPTRDPAKCLFCGDCIRSCPTDAWSAGATGWVVRVGGKHGRHPLTGPQIARFVPDAKLPEIVEAVLQWFETRGAGKGRTRIGTLLREPSLWLDFLAHVKPALGKYVIENPPPPRSNEIHQ